MCRPYASHAVFLVGAVVLFACALSLAGCSRDSTADGTTAGSTGTAGQLLAPRPTETGIGFGGARALYPLAVGNRWDYVIRWRSTLVTEAESRPQASGEESLRVEIIGMENYGRDYFVQKTSGPGSDPLSRFTLVRKDRSGLYQALGVGGYLHGGDAMEQRLARFLEAYVDRIVPDAGRRAAFQRAGAAVVAMIVAAGRGAGSAPADAQGAGPGELTLLRFPLFVGARWLQFEGSRSALTVVDRERVLVPLGALPAWKIRGTSPLLGPADRTYLWYGSAGLLRERDHFERAATDTLGNVVGRMVVDNEVSLTGLHLGPAVSLAGGE